MFPPHVLRPLKAAVVAGPLIALALFVLLSDANGRDTQVNVTTLLETETTVIGQPITYPTQKPAKVTAAIVAIQPGADVKWHEHEVPLFAYILDGEVTVDYGPHGTRVYRKGEAIMEAIDTPHDGRNMGDVPVRILAVYLGAEGLKNTVLVDPPK